MVIKRRYVFPGRNPLYIPFAGKPIRVESPFVLDPLLSAFGYHPYYADFSNPSRDGSLKLSLLDEEKPLHFESEHAGARGRAEKIYLFLERVGRHLAGKGVTGYSEVKLGRAISLFEQSIFLSTRLTNRKARGGNMMNEAMMKELWSLPGDALLLALSSDPYMRRNTGYNRFSHDLNLNKEIATLTRVINQIRQDGPGFRVPPICYLGEMTHRYIVLSMTN